MKHLLAAMAAAALSLSLHAAEPLGNEQFEHYLRTETLKLSDYCLKELTSLDDWTSKRPEYRRQLQEMLGLWPFPERAELHATVVGRLEHDEFTVEKLHFQALPRLYVTANLFVPKGLKAPAPAILYECGHWRLATNGISYGNKAVYQSDGAWYARNGYVCLVMDTVLAGEILGIHTGTRDRGLWWWNSRGYTPAGVEAWFGIRGLDYLSTRPEVDTNRFGITGHSGGGAYSWMVTALDDRIKAAAPMAGMADAQSHALDPVMDRHCDCNFFINYYRWDFPQVAALAAPRPLLLGGTDNDPLFNLPNTLRIHEKLRRVYDLHKAANKLGLIVAPGGHDEVPELQLATLRWFNRHLKGEEAPVESSAKRLFEPTALRVFETLPADAINTNIADTFVPKAPPQNRTADQLRAALRQKTFAGWPADSAPPASTRVSSDEQNGVRRSVWDFVSQENVTLRLYLLESAKMPQAEVVKLRVLDAADWVDIVTEWSGIDPAMRIAIGGRLGYVEGAKEAVEAQLSTNALAFFAPRGLMHDHWAGDEKAQARIRRRFQLLGQTRDSMRVWDIRRAIQTLHNVREDDRGKIILQASGDAAVNALYAALYEPHVRELRLTGLPSTQTAGPDYPGVLTVCDIPEVLDAVKATVQVKAE